MARSERSFFTGRAAGIDVRVRKICDRAVQIAETRRSRRETRTGTHVASAKWKARYRGLTIEIHRFSYRDGAQDVTVRIKEGRTQVFHLFCRRLAAPKRGARKNDVALFQDKPGTWERALEGRE